LLSCENNRSVFSHPLKKKKGKVQGKSKRNAIFVGKFAIKRQKLLLCDVWK
jgi:hypothetical protein